MKILFTFILFIFTSSIYCQYIVGHSYKLWEIFADNCEPQYAGTFFIKSDGDTIIGTDTCIKLKQTIDAQNTWSGYFFIRESNGKVFVKCNPQDQLLYDFSAQTGDTVHLSFNLVVGKKDTVFYAGKLRKRMLLYYEGGTFDTTNCETWYQGIGSLCGLLYPGEYNLLGGPHSLWCYSENDSLKYDYNYSGDCSQIIMNTNENNSEDNITLNVYPVPANNKVHFSLKGNKVYKYRIEIMSASGTLIESFKIPYNSDIEKNIEAYCPGIYFCKLYEENRMIKIDKLVIEK